MISPTAVGVGVTGSTGRKRFLAGVEGGSGEGFRFCEVVVCEIDGSCTPFPRPLMRADLLIVMVA